MVWRRHLFQRGAFCFLRPGFHPPAQAVRAGQSQASVGKGSQRAKVEGKTPQIPAPALGCTDCVLPVSSGRAPGLLASQGTVWLGDEASGLVSGQDGCAGTGKILLDPILPASTPLLPSNQGRSCPLLSTTPPQALEGRRGSD